MYKCKLRQILCEYLEDVLSGTFKERAAQLLDLGRKKPAWTRRLMVGLATMLRKRTDAWKGRSGIPEPDFDQRQFRPAQEAVCRQRRGAALESDPRDVPGDDDV